MLHLTVRAAATRTGISPSVISEIETGRRIPSLTTWARLREKLGLDVPATVLLPARVPGAGLMEDHLTALAACVMSLRGGSLASLAAALEVSIAAVREGLPAIADRLAAVGFAVVDDSAEIRLVPLAAAAPALAALSAVDTFAQLRGEQLEAICVVAHLGTATRSQVESFLRRSEAEGLLHRLVDRGFLEVVSGDATLVGAPAVYRVTAAAVAATGQASLEGLQRYLDNSVSATVFPTPLPRTALPRGH